MKNYVNNITDGELIKILLSCKLAPISLHDKDGNVLPAITRWKNHILIKCLNLVNLEENAMFNEQFKGLIDIPKNIFSSSYLNLNKFEILVVENYFINRLSENGETTELDEMLNEKYRSFMKKKFKNYENDLENFFENLDNNHSF